MRYFYYKNCLIKNLEILSGYDNIYFMSVLTNNYEIVRELGRGGMGTVYLAYDKRLDRQVAIKMVNVDPSVDEATTSEIIQRFQKEARAIAKLNHPNIVSIYDIGEDKNQYFMVIELLEGQSLSNIVEKKQKLPVEQVITIGIQICGALSYAHKNGIVHRDIKPANIMFSQEQHAKLTDFGIAQLGNDKMGLTQAGSILGSILYIPPEQLMDSRKVDHRADIYSLGVTLFQLFTGRLPFEGNSVAEVITKILNEDMPSMRTYDQDIPEILDKVILKAMKKEPDERFMEVGDFGRALSEVGEYLKNPNYKLDPALFNDPGLTIAQTKTDILAKTEIIKPAAKTSLINKGNIVKTQATKKPVTTQKLSTAPLRKGVAGQPKTKAATVPLIIAGLIVGVLALVLILQAIFGGHPAENNYEKPVRNTPVKRVVPVQNNSKPRPASKPVLKQAPVARPKAAAPVITAPRPVARPVIVRKPVVVQKRVVAPVVQRRPAAQPVARKAPVAVRRPVKRAVSAKKSIGEGY
jgi:serine/threonine protein kinase